MWRYACSDCLRIASYLPIITLHKGIITVQSLNFKMATLCFVNVFKEVINVIEENSIMKRTKDANEFGFSKSKV